MTIDGAILIGSRDVYRDPTLTAVNPATGEQLAPAFGEATADDVAEACALAEVAAGAFAALAPGTRAAFLDAIGEAILAVGDVLIETAMAETGLPRPRLEGERMRTVNQLRMFSAELRKGDWLGITIDPALPDRAPPRADLRRVNVALGPVAVFGASNFPLAFSVAGGDTASALAAGCPVVVKGHPAHPATGELVARAVRSAVQAAEFPEGVFSYLPGRSNELGGALVADPRIKAVGFTGSRQGGLALMDIVAKRPEPIPVFAEMSSINPVVLMPHALAARAEALGPAFVGSLTLGAGQFCTNPGLVIAVGGPDLDRFIAAAAQAMTSGEAAAMLTPGIHRAYCNGVAALDSHAAARRVASTPPSDAPNRCGGAIFETSATGFATDPALGAEVFGASSLVVRCVDLAELARTVASIEGQLTTTIHLDPADETDAAQIIPVLVAKSGRVLANGWPTGVEVTAAMVHGGPYPATSDSRTTSVGTLAMARFLRPVCYQDIPDALLPPALQQDNPWNLPRLVDGAKEANR